MRLLFVSAAAVLIGAGCSGPQAKGADPFPRATVDGTFLNLTPESAAAADQAALTHALRTRCDGVCDRLYVDFTDDVTTEVAMRLAAAAAAVEPPTRVYLITGEGAPIELFSSAEPCGVSVSVEADGATVMRDGELLEADPTCSRWDAVICRADDRAYDWPRLRSEVGVQDEVCVSFATNDASELTNIHATLRNPVVRITAAKRVEASISREKVTAVIEQHASALQWCADGEGQEDPVPMQATLRLVVHTDGTVTRSETINGVRTKMQFEACIAEAAKKFTFGALPDITVIEIPLQFEPGRKLQLLD